VKTVIFSLIRYHTPGFFLRSCAWFGNQLRSVDSDLEWIAAGDNFDLLRFLCRSFDPVRDLSRGVRPAIDGGTELCFR